MIFARFTILLLLFSGNLKASEFSSREVFNKLLKGFYKNEIHKCNYVNKSWSTGFEQYPYGMVLNSSAFKNILVFNNRNVVGTLWPNIGEISLERGVRKYQLWKKNKNDEYELLNSDYLDDASSADINLKSETNFYICQKIESSNFAKKKLIDIFVNQNEYVKKDFAYREKNPSLFTNGVELLEN